MVIRVAAEKEEKKHEQRLHFGFAAFEVAQLLP